ncbi:MBL fold metallo-hydrolase [Brevibacillus laterosporus]|uniref:MBL fold metallo-hydrolase n=1 Tax=Brevibacillus laterosporus TaxID=1465 RepID=UPI0024058FAF|nr:MBL fold metallo-hydrolase [Brevibacillus laterosporus]MDF9411137.1 MBL fold metallo-hydrolase [Brevibacillus laterosporus]
MQQLIQMSKRILYLTPYQETDRPILAAIVGDRKTLLIDAGNSSSHAKLFLEQLGELHIKGDWLVLTHWHWDHVFGLKEMDMPIISHSQTLQHIKELMDVTWTDCALDKRVELGIEIPFCAEAIKKELGMNRDITLCLPELTFDSRMTIDLGGVSCVIEHVGGDHSSDSSLIYIPEEKILFIGDCLYPNIYASKWNYTIKKSRRLVEQLEKYDANIIFLSHQEAPLTKAEFEEELLLLKNTAFLAEKFQGDQEKIKREMSARLQRELTEDEEETICFFVHGFEQL